MHVRVADDDKGTKSMTTLGKYKWTLVTVIVVVLMPGPKGSSSSRWPSAPGMSRMSRRCRNGGKVRHP
ncbi:hypothetical protein SK128_017094 [Halocaridina rubra]|uniref:Uncharacterized protein n=1 Tax=Halocaridina rubra TaxID=373956 RepID=A0AAN8XQM9_HALRR